MGLPQLIYFPSTVQYRVNEVNWRYADSLCTVLNTDETSKQCSKQINRVCHRCNQSVKHEPKILINNPDQALCIFVLFSA